MMALRGNETEPILPRLNRNTHIQLGRPRFGNNCCCGARLLKTHHKFKRLLATTPREGNHGRYPECKCLLGLVSDFLPVPPTHHQMPRTTPGLQGHTMRDTPIQTCLVNLAEACSPLEKDCHGERVHKLDFWFWVSISRQDTNRATGW